MTAIDTSPYLSGNYAPVTDEVTAFDLQVIGELPAELNGRYLRNGPNPMDRSTRRPITGSWATAWSTASGSARARPSGTATATSARTADSEPPRRPRHRRPQLERLGPRPEHQRRRLRRHDVGDGRSRRLPGRVDLRARHRRPATTSTARCPAPSPPIPKSTRPPARCTPWSTPGRSGWTTCSTSSSARRRQGAPHASTSRSPGTTMLHDMSLTERYAVVYDLPCRSTSTSRSPAAFPFRWNPDYGNRVGLLPREGDADRHRLGRRADRYSFHPMNAYDDADGSVVIDLCVYDRDVRP